jgi:muconolactone delta-isomerase
MDRMDETSKKLQITLKGAWVDAPAHVFYLLADAPNAHAVNNLMTELQFFHWNTIDIHPVTTLEEAMVLAKDA